LFLDEVGEISPSIQTKLLRVLQERELQRVGGSETVKVDVRVVAATNRDLEKMVQDGTFRQDLYYRLNVLPLVLPGLRERREAVRPLATYFLERQSKLMHRRMPRVSEGAWAALEAHDWPGNVRELENFVQRALILSPGDELRLPELPAAAPRTAAGAPSPAPDGEPAVPGPFDDEVRELIERALAHCNGRVYGPQGAAALLGLKPTTLQGKMRKYGVGEPKVKGGEV
ncbi:MAG: sigma 54-interacting transcriptional regulator, partial [Anaeromyxobacteraceae bacterium]